MECGCRGWKGDSKTPKKQEKEQNTDHWYLADICLVICQNREVSQNLARPNPWPQPLPSAMVHTLKSGFSLDPNKSTSYCFVSQWIFVMQHQSLSFISFGWAWVQGESWRTGGKSSGKNVPRNPLHSSPENLLNIWLLFTVSLVWSLAERRERTEEPPPAWLTATRAQQIAPLGHVEE